jgi:hypothetical protein
VGILTAGAYIAGLAWDRLCFSLSGVEATVNKKAVKDTKAYVCPNGRILVIIPDEMRILIDKDTNTVSYPATKFHNIIGFVFSDDTDPAGVLLTDRIKVEQDPHLEFTENGFSYNDMDSNDRIEIKFTN